MPYTKESLQSLYDLSVDEINEVIAICQLNIESSEYSDEEISSVNFENVANSIKQKRLENNDLQVDNVDNSTNTEGKKKRKGKSEKPIDISELLSKAKSREIKLSLMEAMQVLEACGLGEKEEYSQAECDRFLEGIDLFKKQNKPLQEIAQHFGVELVTHESVNKSADESAPNLDLSTEDIFKQLGEITASLGEEEIKVIKDIIEQKAKGDVADLPKLYLQTLLKEMQSPEFQRQAQQLRAALQGAIMGKKSNSQSLQLQPNFLSLPPTSENGSISE
ncbi:hypothetical protein [Anabaena azotica]|uniref:Uncharacterized protein n=1 Tax=Anabaena azotica FACHB-119 TaxID=947527 RepID=A0ABR8DAF1_9NOST|nr:hypothetical protein [Anabaena azotica]MBD2503892.1 hypothetical protein [Anabaena azotica FACHB-119]